MLLEDGSVYMTGMNCGDWDFGGEAGYGSYIRGTHTETNGVRHRVWLYPGRLSYTKWNADGTSKGWVYTWEEIGTALKSIIDNN